MATMAGLQKLREVFPQHQEAELMEALAGCSSWEAAVDKVIRLTTPQTPIEPRASGSSFANPILLESPSPELANAQRIRTRPHSISSSNTASKSSASRFASQPSSRAITPEEPRVPEEEECVLGVAQMFPDVDLSYVRKMYHEHVQGQQANIVSFIVEHLLEPGSKYPRAEKKSLKRKRNVSEERNEEEEVMLLYMADNREAASSRYKQNTLDALKSEFPQVSVNNLRGALKENKNFLAPTYIKLAKIQDTENGGPNLMKRPREVRGRPMPLMEEVELELQRSRQKVARDRAQQKAAIDAQMAEEQELREAEEAGALLECNCCYGETVISKMTQCRDGHLFCLSCAGMQAKTLIGEGKYDLRCMHPSLCTAEFLRSEMQRFLTDKELDQLDRLRQDTELAELDGLVKCPFCDFAAICPPVEQDREFRCQGLECGETSCRLCRNKSHTPLTCEQYAKDNKVSTRHAVEEAMTAAMVRSCNNCANKFIKESGCNKMRCTKCGNMQCYVCSQNIKDYSHFKEQNGGKGNCLLHENTEERHEKEAEAAFKEVSERLRAEDPTISEEDLKIAVSDAVKAEEANKKATADPLRHMRAVNGVYMPNNLADMAQQRAAPHRRQVGRAVNINPPINNNNPYRPPQLQLQNIPAFGGPQPQHHNHQHNNPLPQPDPPFGADYNRHIAQAGFMQFERFQQHEAVQQHQAIQARAAQTRALMEAAAQAQAEALAQAQAAREQALSLIQQQQAQMAQAMRAPYMPQHQQYFQGPINQYAFDPLPQQQQPAEQQQAAIPAVQNRYQPIQGHAQANNEAIRNSVLNARTRPHNMQVANANADRRGTIFGLEMLDNGKTGQNAYSNRR